MIMQNPTCLLSKKPANRVCINASCDKSAFICKVCQNQQCQIHHLHNNRMQITRWTQISTLISRLPLRNNSDKLTYVQELVNKVDIIIKQLKNIINAHSQLVNSVTQIKYEEQFEKVLNKLKVGKSQDITGKQMRGFYESLQSNNFFKKTQNIQKQKILQSQKITSFINQISRQITVYTTVKSQIKQSPDKLLTQLTKQITLNPKNSSLYSKRATIFYNLKRYTQAEQDFSKAILLNPTDIQLYNKRAIFYKNQKNIKQAEQDYTTALKIDPDSDKLYNNRGTLYQNTKRNNQALLDFTRAIDLNQNNVDAYYNRAVLYHSVNRLKQAEIDYNKAISLNPNDLNAVSNRALLYMQLGRLQQSENQYTRLIKQTPDNRSLYLNRCMILQRLGRNTEAQQDKKKAQQLKERKS